MTEDARKKATGSLAGPVGRYAITAAAAAVVAGLAAGGMTGWKALNGLAGLQLGATTRPTAADRDGDVLPAMQTDARGTYDRADVTAPAPPVPDAGSDSDTDLFVPLEQDPALRAAFAELLSSDDPAVRAEAEALAREWLGSQSLPDSR